MGNNRAAQVVEAATLVDVLCWRAQQTPQKHVYTFVLQDGEEVSITYAQLDQRARMVAAHLQNLHVTDQRILLLYPPGLDYIVAFMGCLYAGVTAIPAYPPTSPRLIPRIGAILENARSQIIMTCSAAMTVIQRGFEQMPQLQDLQWINTDALALTLADAWKEPALGRETLAFLQYTSGSTSTPKGVMLTHHNLLSNLQIIHDNVGLTPEDVFCIWLPPYHDMGLIGGILAPLYGGASAVLMSPVTFLQRPLRWLQTITRKRATISGGPNFAFDLCVRKVTPEQYATLDLSSWRLAFTGAEPVRAETVKRFSKVFAERGFRPESLYPCYGMAETTLMISTNYLDERPLLQAFQRTALEEQRIVPALPGDTTAHILVGCGWISNGLSAIIVHPESMMRCQEDEMGEIWIAGDSVSQGYWDKPEETEKTFHAYLQDTGEGPFLRTGDLGFFYKGQVFIAGRLKDLIILRGRNYYPQDIESCVEESHSAIRGGCSAAFSVDVDDQERLVVVAEIDPRYQPASGGVSNGEAVSSSRKPLDPQEVKSAIRRSIAEQYDLQVYQIVLLKAGGVSKTSSGKLQRYACRAAFLAASLGVWDE